MKQIASIFLKGLLISLCLIILTSCWSAANIQDQQYLTSLGIDFDGEEFTIYGQLINFANIARTESAQKTSLDSATYVGIGKGITLNSAAANLYQTAQARVIWGHIQAVVISERTIKLLGPQIVERLYRYPENRYNTWLYVTDQPIQELLTINSFFNLTSFFTILHSPESTYKQYSLLSPILMFKYIAAAEEADQTTYIPRLGINKEQWVTVSSTLPTLVVTGAYFGSHTGHSKIFSKEELHGYQWLDPKMVRSMVPIEVDDTIYASITVDSSKINIKPAFKNGEAKFTIEAKYNGGMFEYIEDMSYDEVVKLAKSIIQKEIENVYLLGVENELDIFNLMHHFRLKYPTEWKKLTKNGAVFALDEKSIEQFDIHIVISTNGKYKRKL